MTLSKTWLLRVASSVNADSANVAALANDVKPNVGAPSPMQLYVALAKDSTNASNAGYATSSGSANRASSAGTSDTAKGLSITGFGNSNLTFYQTSASVQGSVSDWASYIMANHGSGASYYNQTLRLPFWGAPQIGRLENGANRGWQTLATESYVNSKVSSGGSARVISTGRSGLNWYRVWSDGFKEQGYYLSSVSCNYWPTVYLLKPMSTTTYTLLANYSNSDDNDFNELFFPGRSTTAFTIGFKHAYRNVNAYGVYIYVAGY